MSAENAERLAKEDCKDVFVNSNPPPEVWDAVWRIADGPMSRPDHEADLAVAKGFMDAHGMFESISFVLCLFCGVGLLRVRWLGRADFFASLAL